MCNECSSFYTSNSYSCGKIQCHRKTSIPNQLLTNHVRNHFPTTQTTPLTKQTTKFTGLKSQHLWKVPWSQPCSSMSLKTPKLRCYQVIQFVTFSSPTYPSWSSLNHLKGSVSPSQNNHKELTGMHSFLREITQTWPIHLHDSDVPLPHMCQGLNSLYWGWSSSHLWKGRHR